MSLLPLLLLLAATPSTSAPTLPREGVLLYEGPADGASAPSTYGFTTYAKGDQPFVAVDEANLRRAEAATNYARAASILEAAGELEEASRWKTRIPSS